MWLQPHATRYVWRLKMPGCFPFLCVFTAVLATNLKCLQGALNSAKNPLVPTQTGPSFHFLCLLGVCDSPASQAAGRHRGSVGARRCHITLPPGRIPVSAQPDFSPQSVPPFPAFPRTNGEVSSCLLELSQPAPSPSRISVGPRTVPEVMGWVMQPYFSGPRWELPVQLSPLAWLKPHGMIRPSCPVKYPGGSTCHFYGVY